ASGLMDPDVEMFGARCALIMAPELLAKMLIEERTIVAVKRRHGERLVTRRNQPDLDLPLAKRLDGGLRDRETRSCQIHQGRRINEIRTAPKSQNRPIPSPRV